ncbi:uncharacterized protein si:ch211-132g1.3 isoform X7 [Danio rerio]
MFSTSSEIQQMEGCFVTNLTLTALLPQEAVNNTVSDLLILQTQANKKRSVIRAQKTHRCRNTLHIYRKHRRSIQRRTNSVKMFFRGTNILWMLIFWRSASGDDVTNAVTTDVTFTPIVPPPSTSSIIWKHRNNAGVVVKVIEWDQDDGRTEIPNHNFRAHASLNKHTGELTLTNLQLKHTGVYTIDINSKEQRKHFRLTVMDRVSKPDIKTNCDLENIPVCSLNCEGEASSKSTVIWQNSAGQTLNSRDPNMRTIKVTNSSNPEEFYTCTLKNAVSMETSDPVYEKKLFYGTNGPLIAILSTVIVVICLICGVCAAFCRRRA